LHEPVLIAVKGQRRAGTLVERQPEALTIRRGDNHHLVTLAAIDSIWRPDGRTAAVGAKRGAIAGSIVLGLLMASDVFAGRPENDLGTPEMIPAAALLGAGLGAAIGGAIGATQYRWKLVFSR
jgi:hypothetical protein